MKAPLPNLRWAIAAIAIFATEVWIATKGAHLPFVRGELGDYLVVILLYAIAKAARPTLPRLPTAPGASSPPWPAA